MKLYKSRSERELYREPDKNFKISAVHRFVFKFAREREDVYDLNAYRAHVKANIPDKKAQEKAILWNQTTVRKLVTAGYLVEKSKSHYMLNPIAMAYLDEMKTRKAPFEIKENHRKLLLKHKEGILQVKELKGAYTDKPQFESERQGKMIEGMIRNLKNNGYLASHGNGQYSLTENAWIELSENRDERTDVKQPKQKVEGVKITAFDKLLFEITIGDVVQVDKLETHPKRDQLIKRIATLEEACFIKNGNLTGALKERIDLAQKRSKERGIQFDSLTRQQQQVLQDMRLFLNLTQSQIIKFIYEGNAELAKGDLKYLLDKQILIKDNAWNVYVLGKTGIKISNAITPEAVRYKTKLFSRREEVGHDVLVYTAFKELEKELLLEGKQITSIKNDRQLRSEDAKKFGAMVGSYPDLRITYLDPQTGKEMIHDLEIDCGYDEKTIVQKLSGFFSGGNAGLSGGSSSGGQSVSNQASSFNWYCNSAKQAMKVASVINKDKSKRLNSAKHLSIYVIGSKGELKQTKWW